MGKFSVRIMLDDEDILNLINLKEKLCAIVSEHKIDMRFENLTISTIIERYNRANICAPCVVYEAKDINGEKYSQNCQTYLNGKCIIQRDIK
jgi:hypothetical protein